MEVIRIYSPTIAIADDHIYRPQRFNMPPNTRLECCFICPEKKKIFTHVLQRGELEIIDGWEANETDTYYLYIIAVWYKEFFSFFEEKRVDYWSLPNKIYEHMERKNVELITFCDRVDIKAAEKVQELFQPLFPEKRFGEPFNTYKASLGDVLESLHGITVLDKKQEETLERQRKRN